MRGYDQPYISLKSLIPLEFVDYSLKNLLGAVPARPKNIYIFAATIDTFYMIEKTKNFGLRPEEFESMVHLLKQGDTKLFEKIFLSHFSDCLQYLRRQFSATHEDAYDASMDTIILFRQRIVDGKVTYGNLRFLFTQMACQIYQRSRKKQEIIYEQFGPDLQDQSIKDAFEPDDLALLEQALIQLKPECQQLLIKNYYQGQSLKEIADDEGKTPASVRKQKERCKESLLELFLKQVKNNEI